MLSDVDLDLSLSFPILLPPLSPHHVTHREKREDVEIQSNSFIAGLSNRFISLMRLRLHPPTDRFFPPTLHVYTNKQQLNIKKKKKIEDKIKKVERSAVNEKKKGRRVNDASRYIELCLKFFYFFFQSDLYSAFLVYMPRSIDRHAANGRVGSPSTYF